LRTMATIAAGLFGLTYTAACVSDDDAMEPTANPTGGPVGPPECPDNPDPACTTDAACGNNEACSACECVPLPDDCADPVNPECVADAECPQPGSCQACLCVLACSDTPGAECVTDDDCFDVGTCSEADGCVCIGEPVCGGPDAECTNDAECGDGTCDLDTCFCDIPCECGKRGEGTCEAGEVCDGCDCVSAPGEADPRNDCADDFAAVECDPSIDIVGTAISCAGGEVTVAVTYAETPIEAMPEILTERGVTFWDDADQAALGFFARATTTPTPSAYICDINIPGVMLSPLGPADTCSISRDGNRFDFVLSAESAMLALNPIATVSASTSNSNPSYHFDDTDHYPVVCD